MTSSRHGDSRRFRHGEDEPYRTRLTTAEAAELRRRAAKYTLPHLQVQRAKIVLSAAEGLGNEEIAAR